MSKVYYNPDRLHYVYSKDGTKVSLDALSISPLITRQVLVPRNHKMGNPKQRLSLAERDPACPALHISTSRMGSVPHVLFMLHPGHMTYSETCHLCNLGGVGLGKVKH